MRLQVKDWGNITQFVLLIFTWLSWLNTPVCSQELLKADGTEGLYGAWGEKGGFLFTDSLLYGTSKLQFSKVWQI